MEWVQSHIGETMMLTAFAAMLLGGIGFIISSIAEVIHGPGKDDDEDSPPTAAKTRPTPTRPPEATTPSPVS